MLLEIRSLRCDGGSEGMASRDPHVAESEKLRIGRFNSFPTEVCEME